jgi:hypothetical protein
VRRRRTDASVSSDRTVFNWFPASSARLDQNHCLGKCLLLVSVLFFGADRTVTAQSLNGTTGLIAIPTAEILRDGQIQFGANYVDKEYNVRSSQNNQHRYFATLGYLPFLEVSLRWTRNYRIRFEKPPQEWPGDRGASVRVKFLSEKGRRPSLVLGAHDFFTAFGEQEAVWFNSFYLVGTKNIQCGGLPAHIGVHMGYGTDWLKAKHHDFVGLFGGVSMKYKCFPMFMLEYDAEKVNGGIRIIQVSAAFLNMNSFSCGASGSWTL